MRESNADVEGLKAAGARPEIVDFFLARPVSKDGYDDMGAEVMASMQATKEIVEVGLEHIRKLRLHVRRLRLLRAGNGDEGPPVGIGGRGGQHRKLPTL